MKNPDIRHLDRNPPALEAPEVRAIVKDRFGVDGEYSVLPSERDQNFAVQCADGRRFVVRIANEREDFDVIDFQVKALLHIAQHDPALAVPVVLPDSRGEAPGLIRCSDGMQHFLHVVSFVSGTPLEDCDSQATAGTMRNLGEFMARIDLALQGYFHRAAAQDHPWNMELCPRFESMVHHIDGADAQRMVSAVFHRMRDVVIPRVQKLRHQVIHQDAHGGNVLIDTADHSRIAGLIDFGDMLYGSLVAEVAVAVDSLGLLSDDPIDAICDGVAGYDSTLPLNEDEIDCLFDMIVARNALTATIGFARAAMMPDETAHIANPQRYIDAVDRLLSTGRSELDRRLRARCRFPVLCPSSTEEAWAATDEDRLIASRRRHLGVNATHFYGRPLHFERARGAFLHGTDGLRYLDCYNNVPQVGHCNPHVVRAISRQAAALNTNTRYMYSSVLEYAERLTGKLAPHLDACIFVNSGSEANDYAWQMAKQATGRSGGLLMEDAYHGVTDAMRQFSPGHPDTALPAHLEGLTVPDPYRGPHRGHEPEIAQRYAADVDRALATLQSRGHELAAFMIDSALCSSGVPAVPEGYMRAVETRVRAAGGLMICDEVQSGFGRMGQWWGHEHHAVTADIVTMGKPVANGHPLGVVVTTSEILNAFIDRFAPFSTFGGNTVACAAGNAVLDVIERDELIQQGNEVGNYLRDRLRELALSQPLIGDVRGHGMLTGLEFVTDRQKRTPATGQTLELLELMRRQQVLIGKEGRDGNILKLRPPLIFEKVHADLLVEKLAYCLDQLGSG